MPKLAAEIWKSIFDELYSRAEFDWWWDGMEEDVNREINRVITRIIREKLDKSEP